MKIYKDLQEEVDISVVKNGSWYVASDDQEMTLLEEMMQLFKDRDYTSRLYTASETLEINPHFKKEYVKGGLFIPEEASLNPLVMVHRVREFMIKNLGLHYHHLCPVIAVEKKRGIAMITTSKKQTFWGDQVILANGRDTQFLLPEHYPTAELKSANCR